MRQNKIWYPIISKQQPPDTPSKDRGDKCVTAMPEQAALMRMGKEVSQKKRLEKGLIGNDWLPPREGFAAVLGVQVHLYR